MGKRAQFTSQVLLDIGTWLLQMRRERQLDLRDVAAKTNLDIGTLSKIENQRTQATLGTLVRFGEGLLIPVRDFIRDWQGTPFALPPEAPFPNTVFIPRLAEIAALITQVYVDRPPITRWMADALDGIASLQGSAAPFLAPAVVDRLLFGPLGWRTTLWMPLLPLLHLRREG